MLGLSSAIQSLFGRSQQPKPDKASADIQFATYHGNGAVKERMQFRNGKRHGTWAWYDPTGRALKKIHYEDGVETRVEYPAANPASAVLETHVG